MTKTLKIVVVYYLIIDNSVDKEIWLYLWYTFQDISAVTDT